MPDDDCLIAIKIWTAPHPLHFIYVVDWGYRVKALGQAEGNLPSKGVELSGPILLCPSRTPLKKDISEKYCPFKIIKGCCSFSDHTEII